MRVCAAAALAVAALAQPAPRPRLVWNATPSAPVGLYAVAPAGHLVRGDMVVALPPPAAARLAAERGYLPRGYPLVKRVAGVAGDGVCARGSRFVVGTRFGVMRLSADRSRRLLPRWTGCRRLLASEVVLLGTAEPGSFDSRYFGPVATSLVIGKARLLWAA